MSINPWAKHFQLVWEERAGDARMPLWFRVVCLAYGKHRANGHASFDPGQVALVLSTVDPDTGELITPDRRHIHRAIRTAAEYGFITQASSTRCLVVPGHAVMGGLGRPQTPCRWHDRRAAA